MYCIFLCGIAVYVDADVWNMRIYPVSRLSCFLYFQCVTHIFMVVRVMFINVSIYLYISRSFCRRCCALKQKDIDYTHAHSMNMHTVDIKWKKHLILSYFYKTLLLRFRIRFVIVFAFSSNLIIFPYKGEVLATIATNAVESHENISSLFLIV